MPNNIDIIVKEFIKEIQKVFGSRIKKIILYGSYARGDFKENSDVDIMILTDLSDDEIVEYRRKIWDISYNIELDEGIVISSLIKNIDKFNYWLEALPFYINVEKEGVILSEF